MRVRTITCLPDLVQLIPAWSRLADDAEATMFLRPFWCLTWWEHLGRGALVVVVVEDGDDLVALAPLHRRRLGMVDVYRFLGHGLGAVSELLIAPGRETDAELVWEEVLSRGPVFLQLVEYRDAGHGLKALEAHPGADVRATSHDVCPVIAFEGSIDEFLATRRKGHRRNLRKTQARLDEQGATFVMDVVETPEGLDETFAEIAAVYHAAEAVNPRLDLFSPPWVSFTATLLRRAALDGHLRLCIGRIDGRPVTADVAFLTPRRLALWAGRYDPADRVLAPGHYALRHIVAQALDEGRVVDLQLGDDRYKQTWTHDSYTTLSVQAASGSLASRTGRLAIGMGERSHEFRQARAGAGASAEASDG